MTQFRKNSSYVVYITGLVLINWFIFSYKPIDPFGIIFEIFSLMFLAIFTGINHLFLFRNTHRKITVFGELILFIEIVIYYGFTLSRFQN